MKISFHIIWMLALAFVPGSMPGQIAINADAFPSRGDTFLISTDRLPSQIVLGFGGPLQTWDFITLKSPFAQRSFLLPYENRTSIKELDDAELVMTGISGNDSYLVFKENIISEIGRKMDHPLQNGATLDAYFDTPRTVYERLDFGDEKVFDAQLIAPFPTETFSYIAGNEWAKNLAEVRIIWQMHVEKKVDAWGILKIPRIRYQVLRQKVHETLIPTIEVKDMNGNWIPARDMGINAPHLPPQINEYFVFWSNDLNHPPAIVYVTPGTLQIEKIQYKAFEFGKRIISESPKGADVIAYPNPAFNDVRFDFLNLPDGAYNLDVYNILGVRLQSFEVHVDGYTTAEFDLSDLKKGTYIYRITNEGNRTITSKRLIIIQP